MAADLPGTQANFAAKFAGVALGQSANLDTDDIEVYMGDVEYEFDCAAAQFEIGDRVGVDDNAGATALINQQVIAVGENGHGAIGTVAKRYGANTTRVLVRLHRVNLSPIARMIPLGVHTLGTADEFVTDLAMDFPYKIASLNSIVQTVLGAGAEVISLDKNATTLDDTMTIAATAPVGAVDKQAIDDATGDDVIIVGDTLSMAGDGGTASGAAFFWLEVFPYLMEV